MRPSGFIPHRLTAESDVLAVLRSDGAAILSGCGASQTAAGDLARHILASLSPVVPDPAPIKEGGGNADRRYVDMPGADGSTVVPFQTGHTDGFAYGDRYPDFIFLLCVRAAETGGESFIIDSYALLDALASSASEEDRRFYHFLTATPVEQTEPGFQPSLAPVVGANATGRRMTRWTPVQRADASLSEAEQQQQTQWLARWRAMAHEASLQAPRFTLQPGETLCLDNYRMLHGRTGFNDTERTLWRIWAWTNEAAHGVPDGMLFSDSRFAVTK